MNQCVQIYFNTLGYMSLSKWKELAAEKSKTGKMKQNLFDEITVEKNKVKDNRSSYCKDF